MRDFLNYGDSIDIKFLIFTLLFILIWKFIIEKKIMALQCCILRADLFHRNTRLATATETDTHQFRILNNLADLDFVNFDFVTFWVLY